MQDIEGSAITLDQANQITNCAANMRMAMRGVSLFSMMQNQEQAAKAQAAFEAASQQMRSTLEAMLADTSATVDHAAASAILSARDQWTADFGEFAKMSASHPVEASADALKKMAPRMDLVQKNAAELTRVSRIRQQQASKRTLDTIGQTRVLQGVLLASLLCVGVLGAGVVLGLTKVLRKVIREISEGSQQIKAASSQVASSSQSLAQGASDQAASLEETSASSEEILTMTRRNADDSQAACQLVQSSQRNFADASEKLEHMVVTTREITSSSDKIAKIIKVIDEIAFQTNITAFTN
jgi:methyl-accepting chemotaxis protein/methyl-accepting chemotaxis protein-1 (serine sensor receptor)